MTHLDSFKFKILKAVFVVFIIIRLEFNIRLDKVNKNFNLMRKKKKSKKKI